MTTAGKEWSKSIGLLLLAIVIPLVLASLLVMLDHWKAIPISEYLGPLPWQLNVSVLVAMGLIPICFLRWPLEWRLVAGSLYFFVMFAVLPLYGLVFSCMFTGDCI